MPFQNNFNFNTGSKDATVYILNVQPVIPFTLTEDWNLITRTIMPIINQPSLFPARTAFGQRLGAGGHQSHALLLAGEAGALIWGVGPTFTFPTATDSTLGSGKYSLGPAAVVLTIQGHWVIGGLINNQWSVAGWGNKNVNQMLLQPIVNFNLRMVGT